MKTLPVVSPRADARAALCAACEAGPTGIVGHDELRVNAMGSGVMRLTCRTCGQAWIRHGQAVGQLTWEVDAGKRAGHRYSPGVSLPTG